MFEKKYDDNALVAAYRKTESQIKAAELCGCSRETVARAVRRAGIPLTGRKNIGDHKGNGGGGSPRKISDEQVIEESRYKSCAEIAADHEMHFTNVEKKLKRLGVEAQPGVGHSTGYYRRRVKNPNPEDYDTSITLFEVVKKFDGVCQICGGKVNIYARNGNRISKDYPSIDHIIPVEAGGTHTWDNVQLAHVGCNAAKGGASHGWSAESRKKR